MKLLLRKKAREETNAMLTLAEIEPDGKQVGLIMINKITKQFVNDALYFSSDTARAEGSCVRI